MIFSSTLTFMNMSEHVEFGLDSPLYRVQQLHAADALHLLWDPVQKPCTQREADQTQRQPEEPMCVCVCAHKQLNICFALHINKPNYNE